MMRRTIFLLMGLGAATAAGQDGGQLYTMHCAACHGDDGRGATGGAFPPLMNSPWVNTDPALAIKVILHGLEGPVEVLGTTYNLAMPPQGASLVDHEIAAILSYVRSSWGNTGDVVTTELVKAVRARTEDRKQPWTAGELLKEHPLPVTESALRNLTFQAFFGEFPDLPDFSKLTAQNIETENRGLISGSHGLREQNFAVLWLAEFMAPADGEYVFKLDSDDMSRVLINGTEVVEVAGMGPMGRAQEGNITLAKGPQPIRIEFVQGAGEFGIALAWKGPDGGPWQWLSEQTGGGVNPWPNIPILANDDAPVIYRNFIGGTTPRAIGVGFPGGVNLAWSADHHAPELIWRGLFMDGGRHWTDRGVGPEPPAGDDVVKSSNAPAFAKRAESSARWPDKLELDVRFRGYKLGGPAEVLFSLEAGGMKVLDSYSATADRALLRTIKTDGTATDPVAMLITRGTPVSPAGGGTYQLDGGVRITVQPSNALRLLQDGSLVLALEPRSSTQIRYSWP